MPLRLDGLSLTFAALILFIGLLIILYAAYYFNKEPSNVRFFTLFLIFMGSMLGIVSSDHLLSMIVFWEMTSLASFFLIAYWYDQSSAREGAIIALSVTAFGGLALLASMLLLAYTAGSFSLTTILQQGDIIKNSSYYPWILILFLIGVFTKSAQFPFHFGFLAPCMRQHRSAPICTRQRLSKRAFFFWPVFIQCLPEHLYGFMWSPA